jgi:hypothetical protein
MKSWKKKFPNEDGRWWFYGTIQLDRITNAGPGLWLLYIDNNEVSFEFDETPHKKSIFKGMWQKVIEPELPNV